MSRLRKSLGIDRVELKRINDFKKLILWLDRLVVILEENYKIQKDFVEGRTGFETPNWKGREAVAADVTANQAQAVGNLIIEHKTNGTKREFEA